MKLKGSRRAKEFLRETRKEFDEEYKQRTAPMDEFERQRQEWQENPELLLTDKKAIKFLELAKRLGKSFEQVQVVFRNLLLAHAGGAILTINLLPDIISNKNLFQLATNALFSFSYGILLLLITAISVFISNYWNDFQSFTELIGIKWFKSIKWDVPSAFYFLAGICMLISLYLFFDGVFSTANGLSALIIAE